MDTGKASSKARTPLFLLESGSNHMLVMLVVIFTRVLSNSFYGNN
jgi:hypothetical protein